MTLIIYILVCFLITAGVELHRLLNQYAAARAISDEMEEENARLHGFNMDVLRAKLAAEKKVITAQMAFADIANQNQGDPQYGIWARKRAADTLNLIN